MKQQLLLLKDVDGLGRSGDLVTARSGFIRNFLLPKKLAVIADKHTLKLQAQLKEQRGQQAAIDRKDSEELAAKLATLEVSTEVKVDPEGKMYGSISSLNVSRLLNENGYIIDRKQVVLSHPIKTLGAHTIHLKLKEGVTATFTLQVKPEGGEVLAEEKKETEETKEEEEEEEKE